MATIVLKLLLLLLLFLLFRVEFTENRNDSEYDHSSRFEAIW